jgi:triosephosphate isomerase
MSRTKLIAANWKMHKAPHQAEEFMRHFLASLPLASPAEIVICAPFVDLAVVACQAADRVGVGAQNLHWEREGAFTGEVSAGMLVAAGCTHVIIGHSERRQFFGETDDTANLKLKAALAAKLKPIFCVGELLEEREAGLTEEVLRRQCVNAFREISAEDAAPIAMAYEPVWAIGTGKTATPQLAAEAHRVIRAEVAESIGQPAADRMRILYGGSVKPDNAKALMSEAEIDGALVGGASLDVKSFAAIVAAAG